jgi:hypothetical protein
MEFEKRREIRAIIERGDRGEFGDGSQAIDKLLGLLTAATRNYMDPYYKYCFPSLSVRGKGHDLNFSDANAGPQSRLEIRAVRPQKNMDVWVHQIELLEGRINYLKKFTKPIRLRPILEVKRVTSSTRHEEMEKLVYTPQVDVQQTLRAFWTYVHESGQRWQDHRDYLWPNWIKSGEVRNFENSKWFKRHEHMSACQALLGNGSGGNS